MDIGLLVFGVSGLLALVAFMPPLAGRLRLPYSVLLAIVGFILGVLIHLHGWAPGLIGDFLDTVEHFQISSETFLFVFLPVLLFEAALATNVRRMLEDFGPIMVMAVVAVVVCTVAVGVSLAAISSYGLVVCLILGAIVATTDPAAVIGIFREVGAPKRLTNLVKGESLFNDAASIALYTVLTAALVGGAEISTLAILNDFLYSFVGGVVAGLLMGGAAVYVFRWLRGWPAAEITLTVALAYLSFFIGEHYLQVSGVVATVVAGLVLSATGRTRMSPTTYEQLEGSWEQFGFWANSLIFLFAAMLIPRMMAEISWIEVGLILVLYAVTMAARAFVVYVLLPFLGFMHLGSKVNPKFRAVMVAGGLRGAVSLALALAVTEQHQIPHDLRQFIAVATTGFVLLTLFVNGLALRPLISRLGLNQLSPIDRAMRDQAQFLELETLSDKILAIAKQEHLDNDAIERIRANFDASQASVNAMHAHGLTDQQKLTVGMGMLVGRELELYYDTFKAQLIGWRTVEALLANAESLNDSVRSNGLQGYQDFLAKDTKYTHSLYFAVLVHQLTGWQFWLVRALSRRFAYLMAKWSVLRDLESFIRVDIQPLLGGEVCALILQAHQERLQVLEDGMQAMSLQYPKYATALQESYLARMARALERNRYRDMLAQNLISGETYADLIEQTEQRWHSLERYQRLDIVLDAKRLLQKVAFFEDLQPSTLQAISKALKPRLALPGRQIPTRLRRTRAMYFVASGAVALDLPDGTSVELGSGQIFGELALAAGQDFEARAYSLGYTRLLMLQERDFKRLQQEHPDLRARIDEVVGQRLRAVEVWQQFENGERQHESLPDL